MMRHSQTAIQSDQQQPRQTAQQHQQQKQKQKRIAAEQAPSITSPSSASMKLRTNNPYAFNVLDSSSNSSRSSLASSCSLEEMAFQHHQSQLERQHRRHYSNESSPAVDQLATPSRHPADVSFSSSSICPPAPEWTNYPQEFPLYSESNGEVPVALVMPHRHRKTNSASHTDDSSSGESPASSIASTPIFHSAEDALFQPPQLHVVPRPIGDAFSSTFSSKTPSTRGIESSASSFGEAATPPRQPSPASSKPNTPPPQDSAVASTETSSDAPPVLYHAPKLQGVCELVTFPSDMTTPAHWPEGRCTDGDDSTTFRAFVGQVRFKTTVMEIAYLVEHLTSQPPKYVTQHRVGCFVVHFDSAAHCSEFISLNARVYFDLNGVWVARSNNALAAVKQQVLDVSATGEIHDEFRKLRLPYRPMVVESFTPKAPRPAPATKRQPEPKKSSSKQSQ